MCTNKIVECSYITYCFNLYGAYVLIAYGIILNMIHYLLKIYNLKLLKIII
jgi:hypothetical protein